SKGWSKKHQEVFFAKIGSARSNDTRMQYARIKALSLIATGKKKKCQAAVILLETALQEWPSQYCLEIDSVYDALGDAHRVLGEAEVAAKWYARTITWKNWRGTGYWSYPELIVTSQMFTMFDDALSIVNRLFHEQLVMPSQYFIYHGVRACVFAHENNIALAKSEATEAFAYVGVGSSYFRYHPKVGLVDRNEHRALLSELQQIVRLKVHSTMLTS
ncbi:MAG: hypothetical protein WAQ24_03550, partial [Candidatus Saccharimonadales bacterium]